MSKVLRHYHIPLTIMIFNFIIFVVMIMRKKLLIVATIMILFGLLIAGPYYVDETEENPKASDPMDHAYDMAKVTERFIAEERGGYHTDDKSVAVLVGITLIAGGVIFLMKSNDEDFLPGI